ncbi:hypothetical protein L3073_05925 [Ancylomarina sp. DW003]|nr:hypothetical protein [Ancylomarina sp. DW003]MDE5421738.1 hypothetical protein [Ancylomarina sp. DW003]
MRIITFAKKINLQNIKRDPFRSPFNISHSSLKLENVIVFIIFYFVPTNEHV